MVHVSAEDIKTLLSLVAQKALIPNDNLPTLDFRENDMYHKLSVYLNINSVYVTVSVDVGEGCESDYLNEFKRVLKETDSRYVVTPLMCTKPVESGIRLRFIVTFQGFEVVK